MLNREDIIVKAEGFTIVEVNPEESADFRDKLAEDNPDMGKSRFLYTLTSRMFSKRVKSWPFKEDCSEENKLLFFKGYPAKANEIIAAAEIKIKKKREELLGNLMGGVSGT